MSSKASSIAAILLQYHGKDDRVTPWNAIYAIERLFGVDPDSKWKSVEEAVRHCAQAPSPSPMARYDFTEHAIQVYNGDMLTRAIKLQEIA